MFFGSKKFENSKDLLPTLEKGQKLSVRGWVRGVGGDKNLFWILHDQSGEVFVCQLHNLEGVSEKKQRLFASSVKTREEVAEPKYEGMTQEAITLWSQKLNIFRSEVATVSGC